SNPETPPLPNRPPGSPHHRHLRFLDRAGRKPSTPRASAPRPRGREGDEFSLLFSPSGGGSHRLGQTSGMHPALGEGEHPIENQCEGGDEQRAPKNHVEPAQRDARDDVLAEPPQTNIRPDRHPRNDLTDSE